MASTITDEFSEHRGWAPNCTWWKSGVSMRLVERVALTVKLEGWEWSWPGRNREEEGSRTSTCKVSR